MFSQIILISEHVLRAFRGSFDEEASITTKTGQVKVIGGWCLARSNWLGDMLVSLMRDR